MTKRQAIIGQIVTSDISRMTERPKDIGVLADKICITSGDRPQLKPRTKGPTMMKLITMSNKSEAKMTSKKFPATERVQKIVTKGLANGKFKVQNMKAKDKAIFEATGRSFYALNAIRLIAEYKELDLKLSQAAIRAEIVEYIYKNLEDFDSKIPYGPIQIDRIYKAFDFS